LLVEEQKDFICSTFVCTMDISSNVHVRLEESFNIRDWKWLTQWGRYQLDKLRVDQLFKKFTAFIESGGLFPCTS
jgi:hypothetical protein